MDRIADPSIQDEPIPEELFEIGPLLARKIPKQKWYNINFTDSFSWTFMQIQRFINVLKNCNKYDIAASDKDENAFNDTELFKEEQERLKEANSGRPILVTEMPKFKKTAIYNDEKGTTLRNGNNSMIAMFMAMFAQECFPKFNRVMKERFKDKPEWEIKTDFKTNVVRIWQKINEYQQDSHFK